LTPFCLPIVGVGLEGFFAPDHLIDTHTHTHTTLGRISLDEASARRR